MDIKDVENLAELARLELSHEEKEAMLKDMDNILDYVKQVEELKIPDTKENYSLYNVWREDLPRLSLRDYFVCPLERTNPPSMAAGQPVHSFGPASSRPPRLHRVFQRPDYSGGMDSSVRNLFL